MSCSIIELGEVVIAVLGPELNTETSLGVEEMILGRIDAGRTKILLDMSDTRFLSSAGIRVILKVAKRLDAPGARFALCGVRGEPKRVLEISGISDLISYYGSVRAALQDK